MNVNEVNHESVNENEDENMMQNRAVKLDLDLALNINEIVLFEQQHELDRLPKNQEAIRDTQLRITMIPTAHIAKIKGSYSSVDFPGARKIVNKNRKFHVEFDGKERGNKKTYEQRIQQKLYDKH